MTASPSLFAAFVRREIAEMEEYVPVEPVETLAARYDIPPDRLIKLDANENPYGPSPKAMAALAAGDHYHVYPDPIHADLRPRLADYTGVPAEQILVGNGSDELLDLIARLVLRPGDSIVNCPPTFGMYPVVADWAGATVLEVPRTATFAVDVPAVRAVIGSGTKIVFVASPNNPSGNVISRQDVETLLSLPVLLVVDEAYHEFSRETVVPLVAEYPNLIVLRTFSKWAGLAGLRVGYGIFPTWLMRHLWKLKQPYNVSTAGLIAAAASLADVDHLREVVDTIVAERGRLFDRLRSLDYLHAYPSQANFILCRLKHGDARALWECLRRRGIFIRYFNREGLRDCIRISVGTPQQTDAVLRELEAYGGEIR